MTGDGHSKDARMLTEVTKLVNRSSNADAIPASSGSFPVSLDLFTAHRYPPAGDNQEKLVRLNPLRNSIRRLIVQGQFQQAGRSG
jgi:hypothetical protein